MEDAKVWHPSRSKYLVFTADYLIPIFICLGIISLASFGLYSSYFKINMINCSLDYSECQDKSMLAELDKLKGQNIFTLSIPKIISRLTSGDFTIREAGITRELPNILNVSLQSVYPVVAIQVAGDTNWIVLDDKNRVIGSRKENPNVPIVVVPGPLTLTVGKGIEDKVLLHAIQLAARLSAELFSVKNITLINDDTIELSLDGGNIAIFTPKKDELVQLRALQVILADATILKGVKTIDVRFSQPVLR